MREPPQAPGFQLSPERNLEPNSGPRLGPSLDSGHTSCFQALSGTLCVRLAQGTVFLIPYLWIELPIGEGGFLALEQGSVKGWCPWWEIYCLEGGQQAWVGG